MRTETFVGFDSAWGGRQPGAVTWVTFVDGGFDEWGKPCPAGFDSAATIIRKRAERSDFVLVAIDQPTVVRNLSGARPVDRVVASPISWLRGGVQSANLGKKALFGPDAPVSEFRDGVGATEDPEAARAAQARGRYLIEVFPALALPALNPVIMERRAAAKYNPARKSKFCPGDWKLVAKTVQCWADRLGIRPLAEWAGDMAGLAAPKKRDQDCLDAAICLVVAVQWRRLPRDRMAMIGDTEHGYMVTPVTDALREALEVGANRAKKRKCVEAPIDGSLVEGRRSPTS